MTQTSDQKTKRESTILETNQEQKMTDLRRKTTDVLK